MSVLRISKDRADQIAAALAKSGATWESGDDDLRDQIDTATGGDLHTVEMDIAIDLVRGALLRTARAVQS